MTTTTPQLALTRIVDAPRGRLPGVQNPDHFAAWWGPIGNSVPRDEIEFDVSPGGYQRWSEVFPAEPGTWTHGSFDLTDVVDGGHGSAELKHGRAGSRLCATDRSGRVSRRRSV